MPQTEVILTEDLQDAFNKLAKKGFAPQPANLAMADGRVLTGLYLPDSPAAWGAFESVQGDLLQLYTWVDQEDSNDLVLGSSMSDSIAYVLLSKQLLVQMFGKKDPEEIPLSDDPHGE